MLIALYFLIMNHLIPMGIAYFNSLVEPTMLIVITLAGLTIIFGAAGYRISQNLGSTIVSGIFRFIGYIGTQLFHAIAWIVTNTFMILPRVFRGVRNPLVEAGANGIVSTLFAGFVAIVAFVVVI